MLEPNNQLQKLSFPEYASQLSSNHTELASWLISNKSQLDNQKIVFVFNTQDSATQFSDYTKFDFYPGLGSELYSSMLSSTVNLSQRFHLLQKVIGKKEFPLVTTVEALLLKAPPINFFQSSKVVLEKDEIYNPEQLAVDLVNLGYSRVLSVEEEGTFALKGEIVDIYPVGEYPIRLSYFDEIIEAIFPIDIHTHKSIREKELLIFEIGSGPLSIFNETSINNFKNNFPRIPHTDKELYNLRKEIFKNLSNNQLFDDYPAFLSYFFNETKSLLDYLQDHQYSIFYINDDFSSSMAFKDNILEDFHNFSSSNDELIKPNPDEVYNLSIDIDASLIDLSNIQSSNIKPVQDLLIQKESNFLSSAEIKYATICRFIEKMQQQNYRIKIYYNTPKSLDEIQFLLETKTEDLNLLHIEFLNKFVPLSIIDEVTKSLIISDTLFFSQKAKRVKKQSSGMDSDLFAEQLSTLEPGDYVVHKDHGIGKYLGTETLTLNNSTTDYIVLSYKDEDKVYVPVYKLSLLQKHSSSSVQVTVANLKTNKFTQIKNKAKQAVKKLAFNLLELQAIRESKEGFQFTEPGHDYNDFELSFPYVETPDQKLATENIISDMVSKRPMDRLVCGDVGFGKTEIAMRAAFLAVLDNKQVAILVPTTVLAFQHYNTFKSRFKDFPVNIEFISRFKTAKQATEIASLVGEGKIDILIGTHKLLSDKFKFKDLGLLIIDEEQRFGVAHKEKMKLMRESIDSLTLTATPIPRTLHQSFLGIKELSLIKTPPPRRQTIKSYVIREDAPTLKMAIEKELSRGGQVFVVHNKVNDIENYTAKIRKLVPKARIVFAHGQMNERQLEKIISDFYQYKYDILVSTTIIESGIDIPRANTMIVDQAQNYGLSQLHQLRGRIGRSDKKAYAYFVIPGQKKLSSIAAKRLKAIQTYAELGSGFSLASTDLEIRGSGDVLGPEQSGHINDIGLELYTELLKEAISELKGTPLEIHEEIEITTGFNAYIPDTYIESANQRLKYYKMLSNSHKMISLEGYLETIQDQYGNFPGEFLNLISIIKSRILLTGIGLKAIKVKTKTITLQFNQDKLNQNSQLRDQIIKFFSHRPKIYKLNPDYSIICNFKDTISIDTLLEFSEYISKELGKDF